MLGSDQLNYTADGHYPMVCMMELMVGNFVRDYVLFSLVIIKKFLDTP